MSTTALALSLGAAACLGAYLASRLRHRWRGALSVSEVPAYLDRADFGMPEGGWLLVVFTAKSCRSCASVVRSIESLASLAAAGIRWKEVEKSAQPELHDRHRVDAVPLTLAVNPSGEVELWFRGPLSPGDVKLLRNLVTPEVSRTLSPLPPSPSSPSN